MNKNHSRWMEPLLTRALGAFPVVVVAGLLVLRPLREPTLDLV
jgi:hypothetical protein